MARPIFDEVMTEKVHIRLDNKEMEAIDAICAHEGRQRSDVVRLCVSLALRIYPSFSSFTEIINTDLAGLARKVLEGQKKKKKKRR